MWIRNRKPKETTYNKWQYFVTHWTIMKSRLFFSFFGSILEACLKVNPVALKPLIKLIPIFQHNIHTQRHTKMGLYSTSGVAFKSQKD